MRVDPVEGGSANDYDYSNQDCVNNYDLDGLSATIGPETPFKVQNFHGPCRPGSMGQGRYRFRSPKVVGKRPRGVVRDLSGGDGRLFRLEYREYGFAAARTVSSCEKGGIVVRHYYDRPVHRVEVRLQYTFIVNASAISSGSWRPGH